MRKPLDKALCLAALLLLGACAAPTAASDDAGLPPSQAAEAPLETEAAPEDVVTMSFTGLASWYGKRFHGRRTASGERFDMTALTAAHPNLPFGSRVRVTNLANGRSVVVIINDRGPMMKSRLIDLSHAAARQLGIVEDGVAEVRVDVLADTAS
ncbi:MAG: hypothetical protein Kow00114_05960 [Kiloniellaceae bacterium]